MRKAAIAAAALALTGAAVLWLLRPASHSGPAITERARQASVTDAAAPSSKLIAREDLPPAGTRSLFDHLVAQADGVPYPFEKLVALIQKLDPQGSPPLVLMIPQGRSLLKAQADFVHPRILAAADFQAANTPGGLGLAPRGQLFVGFVEGASEIEVISYNEAAGRFEFQLVQDYREQGERKLVYARRAICETCHQGATPIFPQRPWSETNGQPEIAAKIAAARREAGFDDKQYLGFAIAQPLATPERFDELTDIGNFIAATQKLWLDQCSTADCRRAMLKLALGYARTPGDFDAHSPAAENLRALQTASNTKTVAVPESDLPNRDPLGEKKGLKGWWRSLFTPAIKPGEGAKNNEDLEAFDRLPRLPARLDPLNLRAPKRLLGAADIDGVYGLASLFSESDLHALQAAAGFDWNRVEAGVDRLPASAFAPAAFSRVQMLQALLAPGVIAASKSAGPAPGYCCLDTAEMSPPIVSGTPPLALAADSPLQPYVSYCFTCHRGNPAKRLNFMAGASESEVLSSLRGKSEIREALDWPRYANTDKASKLMPPADSAQHAALSEALQRDPQLLEKMRAVVPTLFDF